MENKALTNKVNELESNLISLRCALCSLDRTDNCRSCPCASYLTYQEIYENSVTDNVKGPLLWARTELIKEFKSKNDQFYFPDGVENNEMFIDTLLKIKDNEVKLKNHMSTIFLLSNSGSDINEFCTSVNKFIKVLNKPTSVPSSGSSGTYNDIKDQVIDKTLGGKELFRNSVACFPSSFCFSNSCSSSSCSSNSCSSSSCSSSSCSSSSCSSSSLFLNTV